MKVLKFYWKSRNIYSIKVFIYFKDRKMDEFWDTFWNYALLIGFIFAIGGCVSEIFEPECDETCQRMEKIRKHRQEKYMRDYECKHFGECKW